MRTIALAAALFAAPLPACAESPAFEVETVATGLRVPWALAFLPDGRVFVTERPGRLRVIEDGRLAPEPVHVFQDVNPRGEGGLMDVLLHPDFAKNRLVYLSYSARSGAEQAVRVVRFTEKDGKLVDRKRIIGGIPAARFHAGCRLGFGPDEKLYVTTGDAIRRKLAQDLGSLAGKTLRLNDDGTVPEDNPFVGREGARPEIWSYGHRNAQGIDWHPETKRMVQTEHGPSGFDGPGGGDELNAVKKGANCGWPLVSHDETKKGTVAPLKQWTPAVAPASGAFYGGQMFPEFRGDYFFGCLRGARLIRVQFAEDGDVRETHDLLRNDYGRIREVAVGPKGALWLTTSNRDGRGRAHRDDDRVLRLVRKD